MFKHQLFASLKTSFYQRRLEIFLFLFICFASIFIFKIVTQQRQHDFATYYYAGKAFINGSNPYLNINLYALSPKGMVFSFFYPPIILPFLSDFSFLDYTTASYIFLFLKLIAFGCLLFIWFKHFCINTTERTLLYAVLQDFNAGNITIFEQLFLWMGLSELLHKRYLFFAIAFTGVHP
jgi:hypothetical protein